MRFREYILQKSSQVVNDISEDDNKIYDIFQGINQETMAYKTYKGY